MSFEQGLNKVSDSQSRKVHFSIPPEQRKHIVTDNFIETKSKLYRDEGKPLQEKRKKKMSEMPKKYKQLLISGSITALVTSVIMYLLTDTNDDKTKTWGEIIKSAGTIFLIVFICYVVVSSIIDNFLN